MEEEKQEIKEKKKIDKKALIAIIILAIAIIGAIIFIVVISINKDKKDNNNTNEITITFNTNGGTATNNITTKIDEEITLPTITKKGYTFLGWYKGENKLEEKAKFKENTTLVAKWQKIEEKSIYKLTFDSNGGSKVKSTTFDCNYPLYLDDYDIITEKRNYYLTNWYNKKDNKTYTRGMILACEDTTFVANWEQEYINISFYSKINDQYEWYDTLSTKLYCSDNMKLKLPDAPQIDGYLFMGWYDNNHNRYVKDNENIKCEYLSLEGKYTAVGVVVPEEEKTEE